MRLANVPTPIAIASVSADHDVDLVRRDAELIGGDLRQRRAMALPLRRCAREQANLAGAQYPHGRALERSEPAPFHVICDTDPDVSALRARRRLPGWKVRVVGELVRLGLACRIVAAVVGQRLAVAKHEPDRIRHLLRPDQVAGAQRGGIKRERARRLVHQALHGEHRLRPAGAAHRRGRHRLVNAPSRRARTLGTTYGPGTSCPRSAATRCRAARRRRRRARASRAARGSRRRRASAIARSQHWSRSCVAARKCSRRSSIHLTGRSSASAHQATTAALRIEQCLGAEAAADVGHDHAQLARIEPQQNFEVAAIEVRTSARHSRP